MSQEQITSQLRAKFAQARTLKIVFFAKFVYIYFSQRGRGRWATELHGSKVDLKELGTKKKYEGLEGVLLVQTSTIEQIKTGLILTTLDYSENLINY